MHNPRLEVALSPCPNDVYIFSALLLKKIPTFLDLKFVLEDIETLNQLAKKEKMDVIKASLAIWNDLYQNYQLLEIGCALGFGVGPILVGRKKFSLEEFPYLKIGIPGINTTAHFLFNFFYSGTIQKVFLPYHEIIPALLEKTIDLGILIHEGRFIFSKYNLCFIVDLGKVWESENKVPVPLGGFFIKRSLNYEVKKEILRVFRASLFWAQKNEELIFPLLQTYAQEMQKEVIKKHIETYVNENTFKLKDEGKKALKVLAQLLGIKEDLKNLILEEETL
ncbi:MAG: 1,4-dihydroxy-6-naphthoate synthase [Thermodesulfobacterium sp.]|nr:1,4-dihydroxy-6-naphthoate synthase [Thermodesulfobacterium sp.]